ncbi:MAG: lysine biosynthesis protein LysX [Nitrososphaerota archaeon]|nr:lysine biosynthesis protein LysX [Nitrososphaerota archaeon]MDG6939050.1 lysine biosynthesis protein LysX [Nitrososphaerota archaeon]
MRLTIAYDRLRLEEKLLLEEAKAMNVEASMEDVKTASFDLTAAECRSDVVLQRCISHVRGLHVAAAYEGMGARVVNSSEVTRLCGDKMLATIALAREGIPTPRTRIAFSAEGAMQALDGLGYPAVIKPVIGSWGRLVAKVRDRDEAQTVIESRRAEDPYDQLFYVQEYVRRPPRDVRVIVVGDRIAAAIYRYQPDGDWRTNVARGGKAEPAKMSGEEQELVLKAARVVGGGVLGVDAMETEKGMVVHEVNGTVEFKGAASVTPGSIPKEIIRYAMETAKR